MDDLSDQHVLQLQAFLRFSAQKRRLHTREALIVVDDALSRLRHGVRAAMLLLQE